MAAPTVYEQLASVRKELAAEKKRADAAEHTLYDRYFVAALTGLAARYEFDTPTRTLIQQAERLTVAALEARRLYKAGHSPNVPPVPSNGVPAKPQGAAK
jgi:hypothetical protein